eukprot:211598-Rhodomonas_salina.2
MSNSIADRAYSRRITLDRQHGHPRLCDIHCCGVRYSVYSVTAQFVIYTQPRSSSYFSTIPFSPDLRRPAASFNRASDFEKALMQVGRDRVRVPCVSDQRVGARGTRATGRDPDAQSRDQAGAAPTRGG